MANNYVSRLANRSQIAGTSVDSANTWQTWFARFAGNTVHTVFTVRSWPSVRAGLTFDAGRVDAAISGVAFDTFRTGIAGFTVLCRSAGLTGNADLAVRTI